MSGEEISNAISQAMHAMYAKGWRLESTERMSADQAYKAGFEMGWEMVLQMWSAAASDEYSQPMLKSEAARLFDKDWRTIERRCRIVELTTKYVRIHKEDLPPTVDTPKKIWQ